MKIHTGIDGGSTKTLSISADEKGNIIGVSEKGPSNYHVIGIDNTIRNINESIKKSIKNINKRYSDVVTLGLAGMDTKYDFELFKKTAVPKILGKKVFIRHDAEIALVGATKGKPGVIIIAGTGSVAGGRNSKGDYKRCGGWGYIVGDEGSAYYLGRRAITAILWAYDRRGENTLLREKIFRALKIKSEEEIIRKIYVEKMTVKEIAKLAPLVTETAKEGDKVARDIIEDAAYNLALHAIALIKELKLYEEKIINIATVGGVFRAGEIILDPFKKYLKRNYKVKIIRPAFPPAAGALILSYILSGIDINEEILNNIKNGLLKYKLL